MGPATAGGGGDSFHYNTDLVPPGGVLPQEYNGTVT